MSALTVYALQDGLTLLRLTDSSQAHSRPQAGAVILLSTPIIVSSSAR